jgi:hypothetical protein
MVIVTGAISNERWSLQKRGALATGSQTQLPQPISAAEALGDWAECWYPVANAPGSAIR